MENTNREGTRPAAQNATESSKLSRAPPELTIVGIGASAGGLGALKTLFGQMPASPGVAFVVVVHLSPQHESHMADLLQPHCPMPMLQVSETVKIERDHVYIIPPNANLSTIDTHLRLSKLEELRLERAPIDHFFRTLAEAHDGRAIGVILTGTGSDGTCGLRWIKEHGGVTIAQSPEEAEYDGMPRSAIASGAVDLILPLAEIPSHVLRIAGTEPRVPISADADQALEGQERTLETIFAQIRVRTGQDFTHYKRSTVMRRIRRRMQLQQIEELSAYLDFLREHREEVIQLFNDLLITVTEFFRDREVYERLEQQVIPELFEHKGPADRVRVWSVGCSTGEEAYSLAMLLLEEAARHDAPPQIQIFASDLHDKSLKKARDGIYPESIAADIDPARLARFFVKEGNHYRIRREVRELVVFAPHNFMRDPPFSHLDLAVCRNVLIYLQRDAQQDVMAMFHYALEPDGLLLLGPSETIEGAELFHSEAKGLNLYRRRNVPTRRPRLHESPLAAVRPFPETRPGGNSGPVTYGSLHARMVEQYAPPSILVTQDHAIVHYSAHAGQYLQAPGGESTNNVLKLVREPLRVELRAALQAAKTGDRITRSNPVSLRIDGELRRVVIQVRAASDREMSGYFLVIFDEWDESQAATPAADQGQTSTTTGELEAELELCQQRLQQVIEDYESGQEETQVQNEELQSANEELRSTMEELETSKEELQSANEELTTLNQENRHRVEELSQLSGDLQNLLAATDIATLFLDRDLRIVRFTPQISQLFNVVHSDRGRPLSDLTHRLGDIELQKDAERVLEHSVPVEREVQSENGRWYLARVLPYRAAEGRVDGVVVTLIDITERKRVEQTLRESDERLRRATDIETVGVLFFDRSGTLIDANASFLESTGHTRAEIEAGRLTWQPRTPPEWIELTSQQLSRLEATGRIDPCEIEYLRRDGTSSWMLLVGQSLGDGTVVAFCIDIQDRKRAEQALQEARDEREQRAAERTLELEQHAVRLRHLTGELASAEHRERRRLAALLHDGLQQFLVAGRMRVEATRRRVQDSAPMADILAGLNEVSDMIVQSLDASRDLTRQLRPPVLYEEGLVPALRWLVREFDSLHKLRVTVSANDQECRMSDDIRALTFEAVRELLFNVAKHAGATQAAVRVEQDSRTLQIRVEDDGCGMNAEVLAGHHDGTGLGLFGIRERMLALGGNMTIDSVPGEGTKICLIVPLTPELVPADN